jgi:hypothetical protein
VPFRVALTFDAEHPDRRAHPGNEERVLDELERLEEWRCGETAVGVAARVIAGVEAHGDGAIVLLHLLPDPVAPALGLIVERLRASVAGFVRLDQLPLEPGFAPIGDPWPGPIPATTL